MSWHLFARSNRFAMAFSASSRSVVVRSSGTSRRFPTSNHRQMELWLLTPSAAGASAIIPSLHSSLSFAFLHTGRPKRHKQRRQALGSTKSSNFDDYLDSDDQLTASSYRPSFSMPPNSQDDSSTASTSKDSFLQWSSLGLWTELVTAVTADLELEAPTAVQRLVVPSLLREPPQHTAFLAATGSGKTLGYLLPLLQQLKNQEVFGKINNNSNNTASSSESSGFQQQQQLLMQQQQLQKDSQRPRLLILAPTRELVSQITKVVKQLCHSLKLSSQGLTGGSSLGQERQRLQRHVDVVVATPGRLLQHWKANNLYLGQVQHVVLDEMDTMLEQGFQGEIREILYPILYQSTPDNTNSSSGGQPQQQLQLKPNAPRLVLTSATMTQAVQKILGVQSKVQQQQQQVVVSAKKHYVKDPTQPKPTIILPQPMQIITAPGLHKAVPRLEQIFINIQNIDKLSLLVDIVSRSHDPKRRPKVSTKKDKAGGAEEEEPYLTMVFCNTVSSCRAAQHALSEAGIDSLNYHGELNSEMRSDNLQQFAQGQCPVLVATDLAARGLDVPQVQHVVLFDFPLNPLDYLHRTGRTARGNRTGGKVTALVAKRDQVLAKAIEQAVMRGLPLDGLTSRKSDYNQAGGRLLVLKSSGGSSRTGRESPKRSTPTSATSRLKTNRGSASTKSGTTSSTKSESSYRTGRSKSSSSTARRATATATRKGVSSSKRSKFN